MSRASRTRASNGRETKISRYASAVESRTTELFFVETGLARKEARLKAGANRPSAERETWQRRRACCTRDDDRHGDDDEERFVVSARKRNAHLHYEPRVGSCHRRTEIDCSFCANSRPIQFASNAQCNAYVCVNTTGSGRLVFSVLHSGAIFLSTLLRGSSLVFARRPPSPRVRSFPTAHIQGVPGVTRVRLTRQGETFVEN